MARGVTPRALLVGVLVVAVGVGALLGWRWLTRPATIELAGDDVAGPVILVPGYGGGTGGLTTLAQALQSAGRTVVVADIGDGHGDIDAYGTSVAALASSLVAQGAGSVDIVGYSMGGLVARSAAAQAPEAIRRIATIGSPHDGTATAALGALVGDAGSCPTACQQMAPGSDFLDRLPVAGAADRWLSAWTAGDEVIRPAESSELAGASNVEVPSACGAGPLDHGSLVTSPATAALVGSFLATGQVPPACAG